MRHELPQFIDVQDKIIGPFTFKQFVYLAGGAGLCYALWVLLPTIIAIIVIVPVAGLAAALAFYKVNNRSFALYLQAMFTHGIKTKFYLWKHRPNEQAHKTEDSVPENTDSTSVSSNSPEDNVFQNSRLGNISWSLDVLDMQDPNAKRDNI